MTRYFYTDPLAAAWMAKHHQITFCNGWFDLKLLDWNKDKTAMEWASSDVLFIIHPDSLSQLKPQVGDILGHHDDDEFYKVVALGDAGQPYVNKGCGWEDIYWNRIIQRNGKAFIMPEVEEE